MADGISRRDVLGRAAAAGAVLAMPGSILAQVRDAVTTTRAARDDFALIADGVPATLLVDAGADSAVRHVADRFAEDLERVGGTKPKRAARPEEASGLAVVIGEIGRCPMIDALVSAKQIDVENIRGQWEAFGQFVVDAPFPNVPRALVIAGSDRRGAVFGTYDVSERIGVSPWHWFADVPVRRQRDVRLSATPKIDRPLVRYRGFFINDEAPCLSGWAEKKFGGANSAMYAHVFELLLRLKGNYLWPAMWAPRAFALDDPKNVALADAMGVVMGNSHHEPMLRAHEEWHRDDSGVAGGAWSYATNAENLRAFWRAGIGRMMSKGDGRGYESVVTVGMRGDGDAAMAEGTAIGALEQIVADQRQIIADVTRKPANQTPQVWALYKEVQDYYDHGMKVPDDVTLLFSDDNWGQIRRLPAPGVAPRAGGFGVYYHFEYVGAPRNYKWMNTNQIEKVWQQMDLAYRRGARAMWIANVGDIKPMEFPLSFFMRHAWNPYAMTPEALSAYPAEWAGATFGEGQAAAIGELLATFGKLAARRKPELLDHETFAIGRSTPDALDGGEFGRVVAEWDELEARMLAARQSLPADALDAYYQLVEYPIAAMANLYRMYYATAWNRRLGASNDVRTDYFADRVESAFARDAELTDRYHALNGGKWDGMMAQVHTGYVIWNDPTRDAMPSVTRVSGDTPAGKVAKTVTWLPSRPTDPGIIAIEAVDFSRSRDAAGVRWTAIPNLGRTSGAVVALPQGRPATEPPDAACVEYDVTIEKAGPATLTIDLAPTLDTIGKAGVRVGVSIDDAPVQVLTIDLEPTGGAQDTPAKRRWAAAVTENVVRLSASLGAVAAGPHVVKVWRIDDNAVVERLVLNTVPVPPSQLGPPAASRPVSRAAAVDARAGGEYFLRS